MSKPCPICRRPTVRKHATGPIPTYDRPVCRRIAERRRKDSLARLGRVVLKLVSEMENR
jgi:hypothetical protein